MDAVGVQRLGDLDADQVAHTLAGDRAGQAGQQPAVSDRVVGGLAEVPADGCGRDPLLHVLVVEQFAFPHAAQV